ncbi:hypothetical protein [Ramlibacter albus]|uniref:Uncharacterized protein n=1 Tax=Ramlibacter albus TaxID=2079448 RepID=A0A923S7L0_9BURK|nr:hypothetical protein [Ramlibacter albus]MBC5767227.1 hypothetical protein [Ramlibacter albus]
MTRSEEVRMHMSRTWLIGGLFRCNLTTFLSALYEFSYLVAWSVLPFILGALVLYVIKEASGSKDFFVLAEDTFRNGELLVFTISMLAPILYLTLHDPEQAEPFPHKLLISTTVSLIIVTCAALFAVMKAGGIKDVKFVYQFSLFLTLAAFAFRFLAILYHKLRMPSVNERELRAPQDNFVDDFRSMVESELRTDQASFVDAFQNNLGGERA